MATASHSHATGASCDQTPTRNTDGQWACSACTLLNSDESSSCAICNTSRLLAHHTPATHGDEVVPQADPHVADGTSDQGPEALRQVTALQRLRCEPAPGMQPSTTGMPDMSAQSTSCGHQGGRPGVVELDHWICADCTFRNQQTAVRCRQCRCPNRAPTEDMRRGEGAAPSPLPPQIRPSSTPQPTPQPHNVLQDPLVPPPCQCGGLKRLQRVRKPGNNHQRLFWGCPRPFASSCKNEFQWADERFPICEGHGKPTTLRRVLKPGPTNGRHFFACSKGKDRACGFFQWADQNQQQPAGGNSSNKRQRADGRDTSCRGVTAIPL